MGEEDNLDKKSNDRLDDSGTILKPKKKIQKENSSEKKRLDGSETMLKAKKKIQKEKSFEKQTIKKCTTSFEKTSEELKNTDRPENSLKEEETPKKEFECGFSVPEAKGHNWGNQYKTIYVAGFDSSLPRDVIKKALKKHFRSCGKVTRVFVPTDCETGARLRFAFIDLKKNQDKALTLNGSDLGGRKLEVMMAKDRDDLFSFPYPNSKGCDICRIRDHRMRIYKLHSLTQGGRLMSLNYLDTLGKITFPDRLGPISIVEQKNGV